MEGRGRSLGRRRRRRREAGARWRPVRVYTAAGGCGRGTRRGGGGGGTMVMAHFVENFWVSGGCRERRGLRLLPAACMRGGRRLSRRPSESPRGPGLPGRASRGGRGSPANDCPPSWQLCGAPGLAERPGSRGGDSKGPRRRAGGGQSADGACAASGAGSRASCGGLLPAAQALDPARSRCAAGRAGHFLPGARLGSWGCGQDFASRPAHKARASRLARTFLILPTPLSPAPRCSCVQSLCAGNGKDA